MIHHESRYIDLDILVFNNAIVNDENVIIEEKTSDSKKQEKIEFNLNIPHLRMHERLFVLKPFCDIDPLCEYYSRKRKSYRTIIEELYDISKNITAEPETSKELQDFQAQVNTLTKIDYLSYMISFNNQAQNNKNVMRNDQDKIKNTKTAEKTKEVYFINNREFYAYEAKEKCSSIYINDKYKNLINLIGISTEKCLEKQPFEMYKNMENNNFNKVFFKLLSFENFEKLAEKDIYKSLTSNKLIYHDINKKINEGFPEEIISEKMFDVDFDLLEIFKKDLLGEFKINTYIAKKNEVHSELKIQLLEKLKNNNLKILLKITNEELQDSEIIEKIKSQIEALETYGIYK